MAPPWRALLPTKQNFRAWRELLCGQRDVTIRVELQQPAPEIVRPQKPPAQIVVSNLTATQRPIRTSAGSASRPARIAKKTKRQARRPWERAEYLARLEQLIDGGDLVEATEETRNALSAQIAVMLASPEDEICNDEERLDFLVTEQQPADAELRQQWSALHGHAEEIIDAVKLDEERNRPSILPDNFRDQLEKYEHARSALLKRKRVTPDLEGEIDAVNARLSMAEGKHNHRGWTATNDHSKRLKTRKEKLSRSRVVIDACCEHANGELRRLCKHHASRALQDMSGAAIDANPSAQPFVPQETVPWQRLPLEITEDYAALKELRYDLIAANVRYADRWVDGDYGYKAAWNEQRARVELELERETTDQDEEDFSRQWFQQNMSLLREVQDLETRYRESRGRAMLAGHEPSRDYSSIEGGWDHRSDGHTGSLASGHLRHNKSVINHGGWRSRFQPWVDALILPSKETGIAAAPADVWNDCSTVKLGETRSAPDLALGQGVLSHTRAGKARLP
ncbi:hypothetical protein CLAFUW4_11804 [Fulvia fulva]|nr:hypothetical protein CLAFUR4_11809 [Fulvia fulva]KAK4618977.1 hypothetical protein CLAFUR0_11822 [Fulvia fulva]WPV18699.1 hypothetical protein CLAFUW4_11804 [Fulvia fulva]WPV33539.1 hypothetical protein CLAFUW7_11811 [Fulvia fulva]